MIFEAQFEQIKTKLPELKLVHEQGFLLFKKFGLPTRKDEAWKYFDSSFMSILYDLTASKSQINVTEKKLYVSTVTEALQNKKINLSDITSKLENGFSALNLAFFEAGVYIEVPDDVSVSKAIEITWLSEESKKANFPFLYLKVGQRSSVTLCEHFVSSADGESLTNAATYVEQSASSTVAYSRINNENSKSIHVGTIRSILKQDSRFESFVFTKGSKNLRNNLKVQLLETGASAHVDGLYLTKPNQQHDNFTEIEHSSPYTESTQLYKGILADGAKATFNGRIFVDKDAQKTNSRQMNKNLLLGAKAEINTRPQLEIFADDVKCSHGATVGQLNAEELFYLQTRNISKDVAVKMLSEGFAKDVVLRIKNQSIREKILKNIEVPS